MACSCEILFDGGPLVDALRSARQDCVVLRELLAPDDAWEQIVRHALGSRDEQVMSEFARLAPFGPGNPRPKFHTGPVSIVDGPRLLKERHLKMSMKQNGRVLRAIQWNAAEHNDRLTGLKEGVEIAYTIEENEYLGTKYVELRLEDFR